jgi:hypothetical protein
MPHSEKALAGESGAQGLLFDEKNEGGKSGDCLFNKKARLKNIMRLSL